MVVGEGVVAAEEAVAGEEVEVVSAVEEAERAGVERHNSVVGRRRGCQAARTGAGSKGSGP